MMGEHKFKEIGKVKGSEYRKTQARLKALRKRGRYVAVASPSDEWYERRYPGFIERKRKAAEEAKRKAAANAAKK
jgi:hypothetical protein